MNAWLGAHDHAKYDVSHYGTTMEEEADAGVDLIIQLDNLPDSASLKYYEGGMGVLGYTTPEVKDGKRTAFLAVHIPGDDDHGHDTKEVFDIILSDSVTCTAVAAKDCATEKVLTLNIHVHTPWSWMMILLIVIVGAIAAYVLLMGLALQAFAQTY